MHPLPLLTVHRSKSLISNASAPRGCQVRLADSLCGRESVPYWERSRLILGQMKEQERITLTGENDRTGCPSTFLSGFLYCGRESRGLSSQLV